MASPATSSHDLIAAIATPPGTGGIAIVRVSGPGLDGLSSAIVDQPLRVGRVCRRRFVDSDGQTIDDGIALLFRAPRSFTGEDVVELHGHGGPAVMARLLDRCLQLGARLAEPGEFSLRAFRNGRIDLAQAEGLADLINATTARAARLAVASLRGELSRRAREIAAAITAIRSQLEAAIDFSDEDIEPDSKDALLARMRDCDASLRRLVADCERGRSFQGGVTIALAGAPNAGKSSLLNALASSDVSIVAATPGTTRDIVSADIDLDGIAARVHDTAGLRDSGDAVEMEGARRARAAQRDADLVVHVRDSTAPGQDLRCAVQVYNKIDLTGGRPQVLPGVVHMSVATGAGLDLLRGELARLCGAHGDEPPFLARQRHVETLRAARRSLGAALQDDGALPEAVAEHLRDVARHLGAISGEVTPDSLLGEIFASFCIGK